MCLPLFNLFVRYDALRGWCVAYVGKEGKERDNFGNLSVDAEHY
jgi:hypothetical protein